MKEQGYFEGEKGRERRREKERVNKGLFLK